MDDKRTMLSTPATFHDMLSGLLVSRGVRPGALRERAVKGEGRPANVKVHGGKATPDLVQYADQAHTNTVRNTLIDRAGGGSIGAKRVDWWFDPTK